MKTLSCFGMAALYIAAGINHFVHPSFYYSMMPTWIGWHKAMVVLSGTFEVLLGLLLIPAKTRRLAAWGIIVLLIAVFPANIQMAINSRDQHNPYWWITIARLPFQAVLIWWAYLYTKQGVSFKKQITY